MATARLRRRELAGLLAALVAAPRALAQAAPKVIGVLSPYSARDYEPARAILVQSLRELGWVEGRRFVVVERLADGRHERLPELAQALVRARVDVIYVSSTNAANAARQATATIPIVFESVADPVLAGFAESVGHPGGNMTGLSNFTIDLNAKRLQLLKQMVPGLARLALLANPGNPYYPTQMERTRPSAERLGLEVVVVDARASEDFAGAFERMRRERVDALFVTADAYLWSERERIAALALQSRLPTMFPFAESVLAGGLMSYGIDSSASIRRVAAFIDKILKGARPGELPIEQPTRVDLVVNRRTAEALGLVIPKELLLLAAKVVE